MKRIKSFKLFESEMNESDIDIASIESECDDILAGLRDSGFITKIESKHYNYYSPYWEITITIKNATNSFPVYATKHQHDCGLVLGHLFSYLEEEGFHKSSDKAEEYGHDRVHRITFKS